MKTITKKDIIRAIVRKNGTDPKETQAIIQSFLECITTDLKEGHRLEFRDFGIFEVVERKPKIGRNPKVPEIPILIPARRAVKFIPGKRVKSAVS